MVRQVARLRSRCADSELRSEFRKELKQRDDRLDACEKTLADLHRALAAVKVQHLEVKRGSIWSLKVGEEKEGDWQTF